MTAALEGGEWSAARPDRTLPPGKTRYPFYRRLCGPQDRFGRTENLVPTGIRSRTVQPLVSRYTDWATGPQIHPLTPNDLYRGRTAQLTSKRCSLYVYSSNIGTEYFKHGIYSQFFFSSKCSLFHNSKVFGSCIIHILYTGCAKVKK